MATLGEATKTAALQQHLVVNRRPLVPRQGVQLVEIGARRQRRLRRDVDTALLPRLIREARQVAAST